MRESDQHLLLERSPWRKPVLPHVPGWSNGSVVKWGPPRDLSQEPTLSISFLKLCLNPPVVPSPVSGQIWEHWSGKPGGISNTAAGTHLLPTSGFVFPKLSCAVSHSVPRHIFPGCPSGPCIPNTDFSVSVSILPLCSRCLKPGPLLAFLALLPFSSCIRGVYGGRWERCFRRTVNAVE